MAAGTTSPETSPSRQGSADSFGSQVMAYDRYIETQLHRTRRQVKGVDLSTSTMLLVVASLVYLMLVALLDHWVVKGGLSVAGRVLAFGLLAAGAAAFAFFRLLPLAMRRVNPVFAAYTIERHRPGLKNSLINFLLLRSGSDRLPERIYQAMEAQAAHALNSAHAEMAVDRTPLIRLLLALVAAVFLVALYAVLSPKNPLTSFRRVMSPWSDVAPPTRVLIQDIQPGDANGFHDQHVVVSAQVDGVRSGESVTLRYSTVDGQVVARAVPMAKPENGYRYTAELPADNVGLQQDLEYWIEAGDAFSPHHKIKVDTAPTIVVEEIEYQYPQYAEMPPRTVARHGDIQALAGTRVTLRAKANQPIRQANLDFECDGRNDLDMQVDGTRATVSFSLAWSESLRRPEHESYQLRFRNQDGHENPKPIRYAIEVIRDLPPEVELVEPELDPSKDLVVPAGRPVRFAVQAADPDFKLAAVKFQARRGRSSLVEESLLAETRGGQFRRAYLLDLKRLEVKPGEQIEFWAAADDNRQPAPNHSETPHYRLRVASPDEKGEGQDDQNAQNPDQKRQSKPDDGHKNEPNKRNSDKQEGEEGNEEGQPQSDDQNKPGDKSKGNKTERKKDAGEQSGDQESSDKGENGQRQPSEKPQEGEGNSADEKNPSEGNGGSEGDPGQKGAGGGKGSEKGEESKRVDPERDAGKAIDEINKYFNEKNKENDGGDNKNRQDDKRPDKQQGKQSGDQQSDENKAGGEQTDGKSPAEPGEQKEGSQGQGDETQQNGRPGKQGKPAGETKEKQSAPDQGENGLGQNSEKPSRADKRQSGTHSGDQRQSGDQQGNGADAQGKQPKAGDQRKGSKEKPGESKKGEKTDGTQQGKESQEKNPTEGGHEGDKNESGENGQLPDQQNDQKGGPGKQAGAKDDGDQSQGEKPGGKNGKKPSAGDKTQSGDKQGVANEGGEKSEKDDAGNGKEGEAKEGEEQEKNAEGETRPRKGQGDQAKGTGERDDKVKKHEGESPDQKGGDPDSKDKGEGGAGDSEGANKHGSPSRQDGDVQREKKQLSPDAKKGTSEDQPESANSRSKRESDSQGADRGDRQGGGKSGGGQRSNSEGTGSAGQNSEAEEGGGQGDTRGKGPTGEQGGDQQKSEKPTGGKSSGEKGPGSNQGQGQESKKGRKAGSPETADPRGQNNASDQPDEGSHEKGEKQPPRGKQAPQKQENKKQADGAPQPSANNEGVDGEPTPSDRGGHDVSGGRQRSNPTRGGDPGPDETTPPEEPDDSEPGGDDANQEYARKATDLALERLKDQLAKEPDPELLKKLGWSREDMDRFVQQWNRLKKAADEVGPKGDAARQELDDALRSLGLRPRGSSLQGGQKRDDKMRNLNEGRRAPPPAEYQEQYIEFNKARAKGAK